MTGGRPGSRWLQILPTVLLACLLVPGPSLCTPAFADKGDLKKSMKRAGEGLKKLGKKVGDAGKEAGGEIAGASKKIWFKGKKVSARLLRQAQGATRRFWEDLIEGKDRTIRALRKENEDLKRQLAEED